MQDTWTETKTRAEPKTLGRKIMIKILAFIGECIIACYKAGGSDLTLRAVRVEQHMEVVRR
jgi:hypothetical protein